MVSRSSAVDYYKDLGIDKHATSTDIRTAYKRLALIWHPDRNTAKHAGEKFKKIKHAYEVLIDENRRREYDEQQQMKYKQPTEESFTLHTFEPFVSTPIDPFDILTDMQIFQESDFTSKMVNSPSYRNLFTHLFNTMNNDPRHIYSSSPIYLNNDRLFRPRSKHRSSINHIPVIHSTMANDWFLNELIDLHEQQIFVSPFNNDFTHCHKKNSTDRHRPSQHENPRRPKTNRYTRIPSKSVRV